MAITRRASAVARYTPSLSGTCSPEALANCGEVARVTRWLAKAVATAGQLEKPDASPPLWVARHGGGNASMVSCPAVANRWGSSVPPGIRPEAEPLPQAEDAMTRLTMNAARKEEAGDTAPRYDGTEDRDRMRRAVTPRAAVRPTRAAPAAARRRSASQPFAPRARRRCRTHRRPARPRPWRRQAAARRQGARRRVREARARWPPRPARPSPRVSRRSLAPRWPQGGLGRAGRGH